MHFLFDPLLGDGGALISFSLSESDGLELASGFYFQPAADVPANVEEQFSHIPIEIPDAEYAYMPDAVNIWDGLIKTNAEKTIFLWKGTL